MGGSGGQDNIQKWGAKQNLLDCQSVDSSCLDPGADDGALRYESKIHLEVGTLGQFERCKADGNRIEKAWSTRTRR